METNYVWEADYGTQKLPQYEGTKENKYGDIDFSKLQKFVLKSRHSGDSYIVDMTNKNHIKIFHNNVLEAEGSFEKENNSHRWGLKYFRRNTMNMSSQDQTIVHHMGIEEVLNDKTIFVGFELNDKSGEVKWLFP